MELFSRIRPTASWLVLLVAVFVLLQSPLLGQQATGNVTGIAADSLGARLQKATVVLTNEETGTARTTVSNDTGDFAFASVIPGTSYKLEVSAANFSPWESQPFAVRPGDQLSFTDIRLNVGAANASMTVEAAVDSMSATLDTGERSDILTTKDLETLTVIGRDATELVRMLPGFAMSTGNQGLYNRPGFNSAVVGLSGPTGAYSANGSGPTGIAVVTDGVSLTDIATNSGSVQQINMDMVSEVKATSSSFSAVNAKGPAVINATSKTGGNAYHGMAYLSARDTDLNSNDWYDNYLRQSRPAGRYLFPGVQLGGPLLLPFTDFNRGRDKLFFFAAFEYYNQSFEANQQALSAWVPTMAERQGDFSATSLDAELCGSRPDGAANPNSILAMCNTDNYMPNGTLISNNNANPYANSSGQSLVNWLPQPNADPFNNPFGYNYIQQLIQQQNGEQFKATLQYNISEKNTLFLVYGLQREIDQDPVDLSSFPVNSVPYPGAVTTGDISNIMALRFTRLISSNVTNEFDAAMSFVSLPGKMGDPQAVQRFQLNADSGYNGGKGGFDYLGMYKNPNGDYSVPALTSPNGAGYPNLSMPGGFYNNQIHTKKVDPVLQDNLAWQKGSHFFQFGGYFESGTYNGIADAGAYPQGQYSFNPGNGFFTYGPSFAYGGYPSPPCGNPSSEGTLRNSGSNYLGSCFNPTAMMYEGYADTYKQTNFTPLVDMRYISIAGYANDTWKVHRLTLTLGARIEHLGPWTDVHNNGLATFSDSLYNTACGGYTRSCSSAAMPGITWSSQGGGVINSVNTPPSVYFTPRVGVAWDLFGKSSTVIRGGWGIYRNEEQFNPYALAAATAQNYKTSQLVGALSFDQIDSETPLNPPDFSVYTLSPTDTNRPIYYEYNGGIDQSMPWHSHLAVSYVGSHNINLGSYNGSSYNSASDINIICGIETGCPANKNLNMSADDSLFDAPDTACSYDYGILCSGDAFGSGIGSLSTQEQDYYRPYPFYQHIYQLKHNFYSNYNSAQVVWNKTSGILTWGANYTFAKNLATAASYNNNIVDPVNLRNDYNPVPYDRTQVFNIHYLIDLGRRYKGHNKVFSEVSNGWQISGLSQVMSGFPLASENGQNFGFGYGAIHPVQVFHENMASNSQSSIQQCRNEFNIPPDSHGNTYCVQSVNPTVWLGSPDIQLMPTLVGNPVGGGKTHQYINPLAFGIPLPGSNGAYRLPYMHAPYFMDHDVTLLKNFSMGEKRNLQIRMAAFNVFNHPLVSFNNQNTNNLTLGFQNATAGQGFKQNELLFQNFGVADIKVGNRLIEFEGKFSF